MKKAVEQKHWTIPMIAHSMKNVPSSSTLYRYLKQGVPALINYPKRKYHLQPMPMQEVIRSNAESDFMKDHAIDCRTAAINECHNFGHWQKDCIDSPKGVEERLLVFYERKSHYVEIMKLASKRASDMHDTTEQFFQRHPNQVRLVTTDRGHEFTNFDVMMVFANWQVDVYFAHPYISAEKGGC